MPGRVGKEKDMPKVKDIFDEIDCVAPFISALDFDNVGVLVGDENAEVNRVLLALDITEEVVREAASKNANLIISHHPVIFHPLKGLKPSDIAYRLVQHGIHAICCHTNLDFSPVCGVNLALGMKLGLLNLQAEEAGADVPLFFGNLPEALEPESFACLVKERLQAQRVQYSPGVGKIRRVCLCSGAGGEYLPYAVGAGADAYLTGEMKHHEMLEAAGEPATVVVAGHYETEQVFAELLAAMLKKRFPETGFLLSQTQRPPMRTI